MQCVASGVKPLNSNQALSLTNRSSQAIGMLQAAVSEVAPEF